MKKNVFLLLVCILSLACSSTSKLATSKEPKICRHKHLLCVSVKEGETIDDAVSRAFEQERNRQSEIDLQGFSENIDDLIEPTIAYLFEKNSGENLNLCVTNIAGRTPPPSLKTRLMDYENCDAKNVTSYSLKDIAETPTGSFKLVTHLGCMRTCVGNSFISLTFYIKRQDSQLTIVDVEKIIFN